MNRYRLRLPRQYGWMCCFALLAALAIQASAAVTELSQTVARIKPAIVAIALFDPSASPPVRVVGTGFSVADGRHVITNAHVLPPAGATEGRQRLVAVPSGEMRDPRNLEVVTLDKRTDLAVLKHAGAPLPALTLSSSDNVRDGDSAAFTGFPLGAMLGFVPVTHRASIAAITPMAVPAPNARMLKDLAIDSLRRGDMQLLQLDATVYPGNSGSPLYDPISGDVIGVVNLTLVKGAKEAALSAPSGIGYAIPVRYVRELLTNVLPR